MDNLRTLRKFCAAVTSAESAESKREIIRKHFTHFEGNLRLWLRCLFPRSASYGEPYTNDELVQIFSKALGIGEHDIRGKLLSGKEIEEVIVERFSESPLVAKKSLVTLEQADEFLAAGRSGEVDDNSLLELLRKLLKSCTPNDVRILVWMMQQDLHVGLNYKSLLAAIDPHMLDDFRKSKDLDDVVDRFIRRSKGSSFAHRHFDIQQIRRFLPDFFTGIKFYITQDIPQRQLLIRYLIAYNGRIIEDIDDIDSATFIATHTGERREINQGIKVDCNWIWNSIKHQKRLEHDAYAIA